MLNHQNQGFGGLMKIVLISCSNVLHKKDNSISTRVCELAKKIAGQQKASVQTEILQLCDYKLANCIFCGRCSDEGRCAYDPAFNSLYQKLCESDAIILVVPFYSAIPSKVSMLMEKINQLYYTAWIKQPQAKFTLSGKKTAIIAHGGSVLRDNPAAAANYRELLLKPLNYSLKSLGLDVVGGGVENAQGVLFGVEGYTETADSIFPDMLHNWEEIEAIISPLMTGVIASIGP
jgi:multimeric flavodoxin WrbA